MLVLLAAFGLIAVSEGGTSEFIIAGRSAYFFCELGSKLLNTASNEIHNKSAPSVSICLTRGSTHHTGTDELQKKYVISQKCSSKSISPNYLCKLPVAIGEYYCSKKVTENGDDSSTEMRTPAVKISYALVNPGMPSCTEVCPGDGQSLLFTYFTKSSIEVCQPLRSDLCMETHGKRLVMYVGNITYSFCEAILLPANERGTAMEYRTHLEQYNVTAYELYVKHGRSEEGDEKHLKYFDTYFLEKGEYFLRVEMKTVPYVVCRVMDHEGAFAVFIVAIYENNPIELKHESLTSFAKYELRCQGRMRASYNSYVATSVHYLVNMESEIEWTRMTMNTRTDRWMSLDTLCGLKSILLRPKPNFLRHQFAYSIRVIYKGKVISSRTAYGVTNVTMREYGTYRVNVTVLYQECNPYSRRVYSYRKKIKLKSCFQARSEETHVRLETFSRATPVPAQSLKLLVVLFIFAFRAHV